MLRKLKIRRNLDDILSQITPANMDIVEDICPSLCTDHRGVSSGQEDPPTQEDISGKGDDASKREDSPTQKDAITTGTKQDSPC